MCLLGYFVIAPVSPFIVSEQSKHCFAFVNILASYPMRSIGTNCMQHRITSCTNMNIDVHFCEFSFLCCYTSMETICQPIFISLLVVVDNHRGKRVTVLHCLTIFTYPCRLDTAYTLL